MTAAVLFQRNRWPASVTKELADLRAKKVPVTLEELDLHYLSLSTNKHAEAVAHFNRAFKILPNDQVPGFDPRRNKRDKGAYLEFDPEMMLATPALQDQATALIEQGAELLRLLHEGLKYESCHFPINHSDGYHALMPHIPPCRIAASILAMEAVYHARKNEPHGAIASISASLHMAEIVKDEPDLISFLVRGRIVADVCHAIRACVNITPLPGDELTKINQRISSLMDRRGIKQTVVSERCLHLSIFTAPNKVIAQFVDEGDPKVMTILGVETMRWRRMLQRDCAFDLESFAQTEQALEAPSYVPLRETVRQQSLKLEQNKGLVGDDTSRVNIISGMVLPGFFGALEWHLKELSLTAVTSAAIAVERCREANHRLPDSLTELVPAYSLTQPKDPPTGVPFELRPIGSGYAFIRSNDLSTVLLSVER